MFELRLSATSADALGDVVQSLVRAGNDEAERELGDIREDLALATSLPPFLNMRPASIDDVPTTAELNAAAAYLKRAEREIARLVARLHALADELARADRSQAGSDAALALREAAGGLDRLRLAIRVEVAALIEAGRSVRSSAWERGPTVKGLPYAEPDSQPVLCNAPPFGHGPALTLAS